MPEKCSYSRELVNTGEQKRHIIGVSQKGSRERYLPVFSENETEENGKNRRKRKKTERKQGKNGKNGKKRKKTEKIGSDTVPATPFAKPRHKKNHINF